MPEGADELIVTPAQLGIVTFRYVPEGADPEDVDRIQQTLVDILASEGYAFLTSPVLGGKEVLRSPVPADKIARIYAGTSQDGLRFEMGDQPVIGPGPDEADKDGAEDPTVMVEGGELHVYYTGWNEAELNAQLMRATGSDVHHLRKDGVALPSTSTHRDTKEASLACLPDGTWRLFFEYSANGHSLVGLASGPSVDGPWSVQSPLFHPRDGHWDSWHLSTGPILRSDPGRPVMFYNGADKEGCWKIGWIAFDERYTRVVARSDTPLVSPGPVDPPYRDIAFASSLVETASAIWLYYSVADMDDRRATIQPPVR